MRVVYFGFPAWSHTVPSLALVKELAARGARVEYYTAEQFRPLVEGAGAQFLSCGPGFNEVANPEGVEGPGLVGAHAQRLAAAAQRLVPQLSASLELPELAVFDASAYWGGVIARQFSLPAAAFVTTFAFTRSMLGLMGVRDSGALDVLVPSAALKIVCTSRYFQPSGRFFDDSHVFVGPLLSERPQEGVRIQRDGERPLVYVSLGTIFNRDRRLLERIAAKFSAAGWQVGLGNPGETAEGDWPQCVRAYPFADQMAALELADLAVTHGGMASVSEIAAHSVPAIVVPRAADQFLVARRTASLGAAVVVDYAAEEFGGAWDAAIARVRENRVAMREAACRIAQSFSEATPMVLAADRLLGLAHAERY